MVLGAVDRKAEISLDRSLPPRVRQAEPLHPLHLGGHLDMEPDCPAIMENCILLCHLLPVGQTLAVVTSIFIIVADVEPREFSLMTKLQLPKLHKTVVKTFLIINISNSNKLNKF